MTHRTSADASARTRRVLVWVVAWLIILAGLALAALLAGDALRRAAEAAPVPLPIPPQPVRVASDVAGLERGRYLYNTRGCADCHGANGGGRTFVQTSSMHLAGSSIAPGPGSVVARYAPVDWVRTIRHGVKPDGSRVRIMPSQDFNQLTDEDVGALIGYVTRLPPQPARPALVQMPLPVRAMFGFGLLTHAADKIDHRRQAPLPVPEAVTVEHGRYVAMMCIGCHGPTLAGGRIPGSPPDWPAAPRLSPGEGSVMPRYLTAAALMHLFQTGQRADGTHLQVMPFEALAQLSNVDVQALHLYRSTLPSVTAGER